MCESEIHIVRIFLHYGITELSLFLRTTYHILDYHLILLYVQEVVTLQKIYLIYLHQKMRFTPFSKLLRYFRLNIRSGHYFLDIQYFIQCHFYIFFLFFIFFAQYVSYSWLPSNISTMHDPGLLLKSRWKFPWEKHASRPHVRITFRSFYARRVFTICLLCANKSFYNSHGT